MYELHDLVFHVTFSILLNVGSVACGHKKKLKSIPSFVEDILIMYVGNGRQVKGSWQILSPNGQDTLNAKRNLTLAWMKLTQRICELLKRNLSVTRSPFIFSRCIQSRAAIDPVNVENVST